MALSIKHPEADRLARELAARTGESITEAIIRALKERLQREQRRYRPSLEDEIMAISRRCAAMPRKTGRTPDEIIGYDEHGLPR
jgi:antitoxin VapB